MKLISLTQGKFTMVDDEDYAELSKNKWCYHGGYAVRGQRKGKTNKLIRMHQQIMGFPTLKVVDHRDEDKLNNQRSNLRVATRAQNLMNRGLNKNNKSGYKGVIHTPRSSRMKSRQWIATIKVNYKRIPLGYFATKEEAAKAYNDGATKYFGEFAYLNPIDV